MERWEEACARLCLSTRAAWESDMPSPMTRRAVHALLSARILQGLTLRREENLSFHESERIRMLLSRARSVYELLRAYEADGYSLILPGDSCWPRCLEALGANAPLFLFAKGNCALLKNRRVAVAGSRDISSQLAQAAQYLGSKLADESIVLISGGARGVDQAAQQGALASGGQAVIIPAKPAKEILETPHACQALDEGRFLILCDTLPDEPFSPQKALQRNHTIYAMGEAAVVIAPRDGAGGSWRGAADCLNRGWTPVFTLEGEGISTKGCRSLSSLGAKSLQFDELQQLSGRLFSGQRQTSLFDVQ